MRRDVRWHSFQGWNQPAYWHAQVANLWNQVRDWHTDRWHRGWNRRTHVRWDVSRDGWNRSWHADAVLLRWDADRPHLLSEIGHWNAHGWDSTWHRCWNVRRNRWHRSWDVNREGWRRSWRSNTVLRRWDAERPKLLSELGHWNT